MFNKKNVDLSTDYKCCIIIPIYKSKLDLSEIQSLNQCLSVLSKWKIFFVTYKSLDTLIYNEICLLYSIKPLYVYFNKNYFDGIEGYNKLLLSKQFYKKFSAYTFMLIHQLDAYVFTDELDYWCNQNYDYIGAPWFNNLSQTDHKLWASGNGGLSLRRIKKFLSYYNMSFENRFPFSYFIQKYFPLNFKNFLRIIYYFPDILFQYITHISVKNYIQNNRNNEDFFWVNAFNNSLWDEMYNEKKLGALFDKRKIKKNFEFLVIPESEIGLKFAFEAQPEYLFKLNNEKLPFGCHAWLKYNPSFWLQFIPVSNANNIN